MSNKELLELAAKALGAEFAVIGGRRMRSLDRDPDTGEMEFVDWNPLTDYGDAFHLAVALKLEISHRMCGSGWGVHVEQPIIGLAETFEYDRDPHGATCEAIVWAAAEIGRRPVVVQIGKPRTAHWVVGGYTTECGRNITEVVAADAIERVTCKKCTRLISLGRIGK